MNIQFVKSPQRWRPEEWRRLTPDLARTLKPGMVVDVEWDGSFGFVGARIVAPVEVTGDWVEIVFSEDRSEMFSADVVSVPTRIRQVGGFIEVIR